MHQEGDAIILVVATTYEVLEYRMTSLTDVNPSLVTRYRLLEFDIERNVAVKANEEYIIV